MLKAPMLTLQAVSVTLLILAAPGCGLLIGNIKPVDEKSDQYGVSDLAKENPKIWSKLTPAQEGGDMHDPETTTTEIPDVAFQSTQTAAVISINSSCRAGGHSSATDDPTHSDSSANNDLHALAGQLTYGITEVSRRVERKLTLQSVPALETALQGRMNRNDISVKAVVLKKNSCVYDLLYMAPPAHFSDNEPDFDRFVASLRLK